MIYTENAINVLTAKTFKGIGRAWIVKNMNENKDVKTIISLLNKNTKSEETITQNGFDKKKNIVINALKKSEDFIDGVVAIGDENFPQHRGNVKNSEKPIFLFYRGNLNLLKENNKNIAVIGLLNPDDDTEKIENEVVAELVNNGAAIVSGLALGCDTIAHKQTLKSNGKTVAILPSPLNNIMPATNKTLADEILQKEGLIVTEYLTDAKSKRELGGRYQERDRLQALFSDSIILSASYAKNDKGNDSGSRLAMGYAHNYSIPRAVIYDKIANKDNPKYDLNRQLINEDKQIIIIDSGNLNTAIKKIIMMKPKGENNKQNQSQLNF